MPRFAILFLVLDAAVVLLFPVAAVLGRWVRAGMGGRGAGELLLFASVSAVGLAYAWKKRDSRASAR
jgi:NADH:ubiquinone oxidoreductase subunit 3 (subunit A)